MSELKAKVFKPKVQNAYSTQKMDEFIEQLYQNEQDNLLPFIRWFLSIQGEEIVHLRDTTGNCLIHHLCIIFDDQHDMQFEACLKFLLSAARIDNKEDEEDACMNFIKGLPISMTTQKESLGEVGLEIDMKHGLSFILKVNIGNSFGQTPLHILATMKKSKLLMTYIKTMYDGNYSLIDFNINKTQTNHRSFIYCLLQQGQLETFEQLASVYKFDLKIVDQFNSSALMLYKKLKYDKMNKLKRDKNYKQLAKEIISANIEAFVDKRNLIFDKELGTNILTDLIRIDQKDGQDFLACLQEMIYLTDLKIFELKDLINIPSQDGTSLVMQVFRYLSHKAISEFLNFVGLDKIETGQKSNLGKNLLHFLFANKILDGTKTQDLFFKINALNKKLINEVDLEGHLPINYFLDRIKEQNDQLTLLFVKHLLSLTNLEVFINQKQIVLAYRQQQDNEEEISTLRKGFKSHIGSKRDLKQKAHDYNKLRDQHIVSPLEICLKRNQKTYIKLLLSEFNFSPFLLCSSMNRSLYEIAANFNDLEILDILITHTKSGEFESLEAPCLRALIDIYCDQPRETEQDLQKLKQFENLYFYKLLTKIQKLDLSAFELKTEQSNKNLYTITSCAIRNGNKYLLKFIIENYEFKEEQLKNLLQSLFIDVTSRNYWKGIKYILDTYPQVKQYIKDDREFSLTISQQMQINFKDIIDPTSLENLAKDYDIWLMPPLNQNPDKQSKQNRDLRFKRLPQNQQYQLISQLTEAKFKYQIELLQRNLYIQENQQLISMQLTGNNKSMFLQTLIDSNILFKILDIKIETHAKTIYDVVKHSMQMGNIDLVLKIFDQLKHHLEESCSFYPIDYFAEILQFERNYPYREFQFKNFIRTINHQKDSYPIFLGQLDSCDIDDDQEQQMSELWDQIKTRKEPLKVENSSINDIYVSNGNVLLFNLFYFKNSIKMVVTPDNYEKVIQVIKHIFNFGGFPTIQISNTNQLSSIPQEKAWWIMNQTKILLNLQNSIRNQNYQTILHQMAIYPHIDNDILKSLCSNNSIQQQNFNSRDNKGRSPIILAIEHKNFNFLDIVLNNNSKVFIMDNLVYMTTFARFFETASTNEKIQLLVLLSKNLQNLNSSLMQMQLQSISSNINQFVDYAYSFDYTDEEKEEPYDNYLYHAQLKDYKIQISEAYKLSRFYYQDKKNQALYQTILYLKQISPSLNFGQNFHLLAGTASVQQIQLLEEQTGYNICDSITPNIQCCNVLLSKKHALVPYFPFTNNYFYYSYALKYALLMQPHNEELITYIYERMDKNKWKPFLFEIMIFIGKIKGTKHPIFIHLFKQEKAYLMGKFLTVEGRLRSIVESVGPTNAIQYYGDKAYNQLLCEFIDLLVSNNEQEMINTFLLDQSKFYISKIMIQKGIESCVRNFQPLFALIFSSFNPKETIKCLDLANLMPNLKTKVTIKQVQETQAIVKGLDNDSKTKKFFKIISRDMMDQFLQYVLDNKLLSMVLNLADNEDKDLQREILSIFVHKSSPHIACRLITELLSNFFKLNHLIDSYELQQHKLRIFKYLYLSLQNISKSVTKTCLQTKHNGVRRQEMLRYLDNKIDNIVNDKNYYEMIMNEQQTQKWLAILGINDQDLKSFREKAKEKHQILEQLQNKLFEFGQISNFIGFNKNQQPIRPNKEQISSIKDFQQLSNEQIMNLNKEELKTKSESVILLHEYLNSSKKTYTGIISNQELRQVVQLSQPQNTNMSTLFSSQDNSSKYKQIQFHLIVVTNNEFEYELYRNKFKFLLNQIVLESLAGKQLQGLQHSVVLNTHDHITSKMLYIPLLIKIAKIRISQSLEEFQTKEFGNQDDRDLFISSMFELFSNIQECFVTTTKLNDVEMKRLVKQIDQYIKAIDLPSHLKLNLTEEHYHNFFGYFAGTILIQPEIMKHISIPFYKQLMQNTELTNYIISNNAHQIKKDSYFALFMPLFCNEPLDLIDQFISNGDLMLHMSLRYKQFVFVVLCNKTKSQQDQNDSQREQIDNLLRKLLSYLGQDMTLDGLELQNWIFIEVFKIVLVNLPKIIGFQRVNGILGYLIKSKRFTLVQEYAKVFEFQLSHFLSLLQYCKDKELLRWGLSYQAENFMNMSRPFSWLITHCSQEIFDFINHELQKDQRSYVDLQDIKPIESQVAKVKSVLLSKEIDQLYEQAREAQGDQESEQFKDVPKPLAIILFEFITTKQYLAIYKVKQIFEGLPQWEEILRQKNYWYESENTADDLVLPYFFALNQKEFDLARLLLPDITQLENQQINMTIKELEILKSFLTQQEILLFPYSGSKAQSSEKRLQDLQEIINNGTITTQSFQLTKKLMLMPELLYFIYNLQNDEEFTKFINQKANEEAGHFIEIDMFLLACGFEIALKKTILNLSYPKDYPLLILEKCFDLEHYMEIVRNETEMDTELPKTTLIAQNLLNDHQTKDISLFTHPYTFMKKANLCHTKYNFKPLFSQQLENVMNLVLNKIYDMHKAILEQLFHSEEKDYFTMKGNQNFMLTYYFMNVKAMNSQYFKIDTSNMELLFWTMRFDNLAQDLIINYIINRHFCTNYQLKVKLNMHFKKDQFLIYNENWDVVPITYHPRSLALLISILNQTANASDYFEPIKISADTEEKTILQDTLTKNQVIKQYLTFSQKYNCTNKEKKNIPHFSRILDQLKLVKDAIEILNDNFNKGQYQQLVKELGIEQNHEDNIQQVEALNDQDLLELLKSIAFPNEIEIYRQHFQFTCSYSKNESFNLKNNQYKESYEFCKSMIYNFNSVLDNLSKFLPKNAVVNFLLSDQLHFTTFTSFEEPFEFQANIQLNQLISTQDHISQNNDQNGNTELLQFYEQAQHELNKWIMIQFMTDSIEAFKKQNQAKDYKIIDNNYWIQEMQPRDLKKAVDILNELKTYKENHQFTLLDLVELSMVKIHKHKEKLEPIITSYIFQYLPMCQFDQDIRQNFVENAKRTLINDYKKEEPISVIFTFDLKNSKILLNECAFIPYFKFINIDFIKLVLSNQKLYDLRSNVKELPFIQLDIISLYENIIAKSQVLATQPIQTVKDIFSKHSSLQTFLGMAIENMSQQYTKLNSKHTKNEKYQFYNLLSRIIVDFKIDESSRVNLENNVQEQNDIEKLIFVTDVVYSTAKKEDYSGSYLTQFEKAKQFQIDPSLLEKYPDDIQSLIGQITILLKLK